MPTHHEPIEVIAGETWDIPGTLLDANGSPIDLNGATLAARSASASALTTQPAWTPATTKTACG